jgi:hypothetical protein
MKSTKRAVPILALLAPAWLAASAQAQSSQSQHAQIIQAVGDAVAALPGATIFTTGNFDSPVIDQSGNVLYRARMTGAPVTGADDRAYFLARANGDLQMVVRAGDQAPGCLPGTQLRSSSASAGSVGLNSSPRLSPFGGILFFQSALYDPANPGNTPTTADSALFWGPVGGVTLLAREGDTAAFLPDAPTFGALAFSLQNNAIGGTGQVLFPATMVVGSGTPAVTAANDAMLLTGFPGSLQVVSREGDVLPGGEVVMPVSGTTTMTFISQINEGGQVLHELRFATTAPSTATTADDRALAIWTAGSDTIIAREGQQAPGLPTGVLFATPSLGWSPSVGGSSFTRTGNLILIATLDGAGTTTADDSAVYHGGLGGWQLVAREGDARPGLGNGELFGPFGTTSASCNNDGQVVILDFLVGPNVTTANDSSIWFGTPGNLTLLAREGDTVPGMAPSTNGPWTFSQINQGTNTPYLTDRGTVLVQLTVTDTVVSRNLVFGYTPVLGLHVQLEDTDSFATTLGTGTWTSYGSAGGFNSGDAGPAWINNNGDYVNRLGLDGNLTAAIVRGHVGSIAGTPSSLSATTGGAFVMDLDCGTANAGNFYLVASSAHGTRPGFPFYGLNVPLNIDWWFQVSLSNINSAVFSNSFGVLNAQGRATSTFNFPAGWPSFAGLDLRFAAVVMTPSFAFTHATEPANLLMY